MRLFPETVAVLVMLPVSRSVLIHSMPRRAGCGRIGSQGTRCTVRQCSLFVICHSERTGKADVPSIPDGVGISNNLSQGVVGCQIGTLGEENCRILGNECGDRIAIREWRDIQITSGCCGIGDLSSIRFGQGNDMRRIGRTDHCRSRRQTRPWTGDRDPKQVIGHADGGQCDIAGIADIKLVKEPVPQREGVG